MTRAPDSEGAVGEVANPPAFPTETADRFFHGMTLRDWFAGQALAGMELSRLNEGGFLCDAAVKGAYAYADAMLRARHPATDEPEKGLG